jgi:hypothetical protein
MQAVDSCLYLVPSQSEGIDLFGCADEEDRPRSLSESVGAGGFEGAESLGAESGAGAEWDWIADL